jgi:hypothetical protein
MRRRFFRMSRSIRVFASSAFSRAISIWSAFTRLPLASFRPPTASDFTQLSIDCAETPMLDQPAFAA